MASEEWDLDLDTYVQVCCPHTEDLAGQFTYLLLFHAQLHLLGVEEGEVHDTCLERLAQVEKDLARARVAVWN